MGPMWFVRMARWVRNPPSKAQVQLILGVIAIMVVVLGVEQLIGWPDWMTVNGAPARALPQIK